MQISGHAGTFPNSVLILYEELSRKIIACERTNIIKMRIRKDLACGWMELVHISSLEKYSVLFALMTPSCFQNLSFFFCFYVITFGLVCVLSVSFFTFAISGCHLPRCIILPMHSASVPFFLFLSLSLTLFLPLSFSTSTFLYFWLSWRPFSVL